MNLLRKFIKSFVDSKSLNELYEERKKSAPTEGNRNRITATIGFVLLAITLNYVLELAYSTNELDKFVSQQQEIEFLKELNNDWQVSIKNADECQPSLNCNFAKPKLTDLNALSSPYDTDKVISLSREIRNFDLRQSIRRNTIYALKFPDFNYKTMKVFINDRLWANHISGENILYNIEAEKLLLDNSALTLRLKIIASLDEGDIFYDQNIKSEYYRFFTFQTRRSHNLVRNHVAVQSHTKGNIIGATARVIMAIFVLALFLTIDSSPETLGLAFFLGFEAAAISLKDPIFGIPPVITRNFFYQMGDIFRLYFFFQLTRSIPSNITPWLKWSIPPSILYGFLRYYQTDWGLDWPSAIPNYRDFAVGFIGTFICWRSAYNLRNDGLPWRVTALALAGIASFEQLFMPAVDLIPALGQFETLVAVANFLQPIAAYLIAFCAFINISTLENRVKSLSEVEARAREITKEMELGNSVQKSFLKKPENIPSEVDIRYYSEAMLYVSGDTYYSNYHEDTSKLTFLINDVTGHGVQAALKAAGVSVLAANLWEGNDTNTHNSNICKLAEYAKDVTSFYQSMDATPDVLALCGVEFDTSNGKFSLYRDNFPTPIIIYPNSNELEFAHARDTDHWVVQPINSPLSEPFEMSVPENSFIVIGSDGIFESSRQSNHILKKLRKAIASQKYLTSLEIEKLLLEIAGDYDNQLEDDKTLIVFHWKRKTSSKRALLAS